MWRQRIVFAVGIRAPKRPLQRAQAILTRHSAREPDFDGLVHSFKSIVDGLKDAGVIVDDRPSNFKAEYLWKKATPGKGWLEVSLVEMA